MNYAGKFDAKLSADLPGLHSNGHAHVETVTAAHAPSDAIIVPDAQLLFTGDFKRTGVDLVLSKDDHELVLHDYFKGEKRAALSSPDGAHLTGDIVNALTGHQQFAQADGSAGVGHVIGHVTKLAGTASAIRNGVSIILNQGDNVEKGDVVQTGSSSTLGLSFIDGTVFGLSSNARMVLNEMVYDPNGSNNSSLLSLVAGTITFVAGETAKHGDMKIDTPVATMGIRGTAVLVQIDFQIALIDPSLPPLAPQPPPPPPTATFQVLVEPDGTTGSYVLLDKVTLLPLMTVDKAGQFVSIGQGGVTTGNALLSPEIQKLIIDVFATKWTDNPNPIPKTTTAQTDTLTPQAFTPFVLADGTSATPYFANLDVTGKPAAAPGPASTPDSHDHIPGAPQIAAFGGVYIERDHVTGSSLIDTLSGKINFADNNAGDLPTASAKFASFAYQNAQHSDVTATLTAEQKAAIAAVEIPLVVVQDPGNKNYGLATWTYNIADSKFDFLAAGETLTLTYQAQVNTNFAGDDEASFQEFTVEIIGTNDAPTISTAGSAITELIGTGNAATDTASGTVEFTDVDLTDRPVVSATFSSFKYIDAHGHDVTATLTAAQIAAVLAVEVPLIVVQTSGNANNGTATWTYSLTDKAFDFLAKDERLILDYVATVDDGHGGVVSTPISVSIDGADVTVSGTNDVPTIVAGATTATGAVTEDASAPLTAGGTITYQDVDLTDTHTAGFVLKSSDANANLPGYSESAPLGQIGTFALTAMNENTADTVNIGSVGWSFTLNDSDPVLQSLAAGQTITQVYTVTITDNNGASATQDVTVVITGTNDAPVITSNAAAASGGVTEDSAPTLATGGTLAIQDLDLIDTHTATFAFATSSSSLHLPGFAEGSTHIGSFAIDPSVTENNADTNNGATQGWSFTLNDNDPVLQSLAAGQTITQIYTVTFDDHHGGTISQPVTVVITGVNDAPVITSSAQTGSITEIAGALNSTTADIASGAVTFTDVDLLDTHTVTVTGVSASGATSGLPSNAILAGWLSLGPLIDSSNGATGSDSWSFSAQDKNFDYLAAGQTVRLTYAVQVADSHGGTATQDVNVTITGTNDAPTIATSNGLITELAGTGNAAIDHAEGTVTFTDVDLTDTPAVTASFTSFVYQDSYGNDVTSTLTAAQQNAVAAVEANLALTPAGGNANTGSVTWSYDVADSKFDFLAAGDKLTLTYAATVDDGHNGVSTQPVTVTITGTDDLPTIATNVIDARLVSTSMFTVTTIGIFDADAGNDIIKISLSTGHGSLFLLDTNGLTTIDGSGDDGTLSFSGTQATINAALANGVAYKSPSGFNGDTLTINVEDLDAKDGSTASFSQPITIPVTHAVNGTPGDDTLTSTAGNDTLTGGAGSDQFVFATTPGTGHDTIVDFTPGQDHIELDYNVAPFDLSDPNAFNAWLASHATAVNAHDVLIDLKLDGAHPNIDTILLKNVALANLHASDFIVHTA